MKKLGAFFAALLVPYLTFASEADLNIPNLTSHQNNLLLFGFLVCFFGLLFGLYQFQKVRKLGAHKSMLDVSKIIFETCKTYLIQQGKFLILLFFIIGLCIAFYFGFLQA
ncbi:MAG: sodium-translocating pyrophosphatase, partial [Bacteroidales bacterium]|nr:sodium-translocating pyrophosphatase [Bacteroidales bacterium]